MYMRWKLDYRRRYSNSGNPCAAAKPNDHLRLAEILMDSGGGFSGDASTVSGLPQLQGRRWRGRGREISGSFACLSPRSLLPRCWTVASCWKPERQKICEAKREDVERESRSERKEDASSSVSRLSGEVKGQSGIGQVSGQCRTGDFFNVAVGFGLFYLIAASKNELNKMFELRTEMEMLLQNVKEEFQIGSRDDLCEAAESYEVPAFSTTDAQESLCSNGHVSLQKVSSFRNPADSEKTELCDQYLTCTKTRQEKNMEGIDQLESEFEAELERLELHLDTGDEYEYSKQQRVEVTVEDAAPEISQSASFAEVVDPPETDNPEDSGVPPLELERRLHELLESRQQERIKELEAALKHADQKLRDKEREVCWWKDTAQIISQHVPRASHMSTCDQSLPKS